MMYRHIRIREDVWQPLHEVIVMLSECFRMFSYYGLVCLIPRTLYDIMTSFPRYTARVVRLDSVILPCLRS